MHDLSLPRGASTLAETEQVDPQHPAREGYDSKAIEQGRWFRMLNILFICGKNKWRSPTAEQVFSEHPGVQCASAGMSRDAVVPVSAELVAWADLIFVMEKQHNSKLSAQFMPLLRDKQVVCLNIPDNYRFMESALVTLLKNKVTPYLPVNGSR